LKYPNPCTLYGVFQQDYQENLTFYKLYNQDQPIFLGVSYF